MFEGEIQEIEFFSISGDSDVGGLWILFGGFILEILILVIINRENIFCGRKDGF